MREQIAKELWILTRSNNQTVIPWECTLEGTKNTMREGADRVIAILNQALASKDEEIASLKLELDELYLGEDI